MMEGDWRDANVLRVTDGMLILVVWLITFLLE
jgi:hypothetical protein